MTRYRSVMEWGIGMKHPAYGKVIGAMVIEGESYRFFQDKHGTIAMMPVETLNEDASK